MALCGVLIDRGARSGNLLGVELGGLPDEVLEQVAFVLGEQEILGLLDDLSGILHERLALGGERLVRVTESLRVEEAIQGDIDLVVLGACQLRYRQTASQGNATYGRDLALLEGADDAVDLELAVDIGLLLLLDGGLVHVGGRHGCGCTGRGNRSVRGKMPNIGCLVKGCFADRRQLLDDSRST